MKKSEHWLGEGFLPWSTHAAQHQRKFREQNPNKQHKTPQIFNQSPYSFRNQNQPVNKDLLKIRSHYL